MRSRVAAFAALSLALLPLFLAASAPDLDSRTREALLAALDDERRSHALYAALAARFGESPFSHVAMSETRHESHLKDLFAAHGVPVPPDPWAEKAFEIPATRQEACRLGIESERKNAALYDGFLAAVQEPDIRETFTLLRDMSLDHHLNAFERCGEGCGQMGQGQGQGRGRACGRCKGQGHGHRGR